MDKRTASRLAKRIETEDPQIIVTGYRHYDTGYAIDCVDMRTGGTFVINSVEEWPGPSPANPARKEVNHSAVTWPV